MFIWVSHKVLWKNLQELFDQSNIRRQLVKYFYQQSQTVPKCKSMAYFLVCLPVANEKIKKNLMSEIFIKTKFINLKRCHLF